MSSFTAFLCITTCAIASINSVFPDSLTQLNRLNQLWKADDSDKLDFWEPPRRLSDPVEVMVFPDFLQEFRTFLKENKLRNMVAISDVQKLIDQRGKSHIPSIGRRKTRASQSLVDFDFNRYHDFDSISTPVSPYWLDKRPIIWIDAGLHSREWAAPHAALYFIHTLVSQYLMDNKITEYVKKLRWVILPMANPDGYHTTQGNELKHAIWRKNKSPKICYWTTKKRCCSGVDLNRNFDAYWGGPDTSRDPCSEVYPGTKSFSEPETRAIRDYIQPRRQQMAAYFTLHTYSQLWGYSSSAKQFQYPSDVHELDRLAVKGTTALKRLYGTDYEVGSAADILYPASGTAMDWAKEVMGIKYTYLLELRPRLGKYARINFKAFFLDENELLPTAKETWAGVQTVADAILKEHYD